MKTLIINLDKNGDSVNIELIGMPTLEEMGKMFGYAITHLEKIKAAERKTTIERVPTSIIQKMALKVAREMIINSLNFHNRFKVYLKSTGQRWEPIGFTHQTSKKKTLLKVITTKGDE